MAGSDPDDSGSRKLELELNRWERTGQVGCQAGITQREHNTTEHDGIIWQRGAVETVLIYSTDW